MKSKELSELVSREEIFELYIVNHKSLGFIAEKYNVSIGCIRYLLGTYKITANQRTKETLPPKEVLIDKETLYNLYIVQRLLKHKIAKMFNTYTAKITSYLKLYDIDKQTIYDKDLENIIEMYIEQNKSLTQISKHFNMPKSTIRTMLLDQGIEMRDKSTCQLVNLNFNGKFESFDIKTIQTKSRLKLMCKKFMKNFASGIKKERGYICEDCGNTNNIHAHHLYPSSAILNKIIKENPGVTDEELLSIVTTHPKVLDKSNIRIVCERCHYTKYHPYMNYQDNQQPSS